MSDTLIIEILLGVLSLSVGAASVVGAGRAARVSAVATQKGIEANAYERARLIYEGAIASLETQLERLRQGQASLDTEVAKLNASNRQLRESNLKLIEEVNELQSANRRLIAQVRELTRGTPPGGMAIT